MGKIIILGMRQAVPERAEGMEVINTCSNSPTDWQRHLSPFSLGPCELYDGMWAKNMENAWQYAKVYRSHADDQNIPNAQYWEWAKQGWRNPSAVRYPMGRGAVPLYSLWMGQNLGYIDARKCIYAPLFIRAVMQTDGYKKLKEKYDSGQDLILRDWDGYDHDAKGMTLTQVLNEPRKKMGHSFVLKMLLTQDEALNRICFDGFKRTEPRPWQYNDQLNQLI